MNIFRKAAVHWVLFGVLLGGIILSSPFSTFGMETDSDSITSMTMRPIPNTVNGYGYLESGSIDNTEGIGAFEDISWTPSTRNFDVGGGKYDTNSKYLYDRFNITNIVYDPYNRTPEENRKALSEADRISFDTATSMSVLNVIFSPYERNQHIRLLFRSIRENGVAYFKVYRGNGSGTPTFNHGYFQSNTDASQYLDEVTAVFGKENVELDLSRNLIIASKTLIDYFTLD